MRESLQTERLTLTREEALGLLDIALLSPDELTPEQRSAVVKLSDYCRQCYRDDAGEAEGERNTRGLAASNAVYAA